jgi:hypothetical protein
MSIVQADLILGSGDQLLSFDSSTGLEWLNLTVTANRSYIEVLSGFGGFIGGFGFHYATQNQVGILYKHAGVTKFGGPQAGLDLGNHFGIEVLQDLMNGKSMASISLPSSTSVDTAGMVKTGGAGIPSPLMPVEIRQTHVNKAEPEKSYTDAGALTQKAGDQSPHIGSYLVRKRIVAGIPAISSKSAKKG